MKVFSYGLALACILALGLRAWLVFDSSWDALAYHLPFAARLTGICDVECFQMRPWLEGFYPAFPRLVNVLQGIAWMITGRPEAANVISFSSLLVSVFYLTRVWKVPLDVAVLAFCAIPVVQIMSTSSYIDMTTNAAAFIGAMQVFKLAMSDEKPSTQDFAWLVPAVVILGNAKTQMMPVSLGIAVAFFAVLWAKRGFSRGTGGIAILTVLSLSATGIWNLYIFGNPVFPVALSIGPFSLPGTIGAQASNSVPTYANSLPQPVRWLASVLEFRAYEYRYTPWTLGQGDVAQSEYSFRMGGYFVVLVLFCFGSIITFAKRLDRHEYRSLAVFLVVLSVAVSFMPASHELRYYMFWMMVIVGMTLWLSFVKFSEYCNITRLGVLAIFLSVFFISGGRYFNFDEPDNVSLRKGLGIDEVVGGLGGKEVLCVGAENRAFLYSSAFYVEATHRTIQGFRETGCSLTIQ